MSTQVVLYAPMNEVEDQAPADSTCSQYVWKLLCFKALEQLISLAVAWLKIGTSQRVYCRVTRVLRTWWSSGVSYYKMWWLSVSPSYTKLFRCTMSQVHFHHTLGFRLRNLPCPWVMWPPCQMFTWEKAGFGIFHWNSWVGVPTVQVSLLVRSLHLRNMFVPTQWEWILAVACAQFLLKGFTKMICRKKICANCKASWLRSHTFSIFVSPPYFSEKLLDGHVCWLAKPTRFAESQNPNVFWLTRCTATLGKRDFEGH